MGLKVHLDGARIFNAADGAGRPCGGDDAKSGFSDVLFVEGAGRAGGVDDCGDESVYREGASVPEDVWRRDAAGGVIAAAGLIALEKSPERLHIDQENAKWLAEGIAESLGWRSIRKSSIEYCDF